MDAIFVPYFTAASLIDDVHRFCFLLTRLVNFLPLHSSVYVFNYTNLCTCRSFDISDNLISLLSCNHVALTFVDT